MSQYDIILKFADRATAHFTHRFLFSVLFAIALLAQVPAASADQYDIVLKFTDKATAIADATAALQTYTDPQGVKQWLGSNVVELTVWRNSQDTTTTDGQGNVIPVHHPLAGYFVMISLDHLVPALLNHAAVQLVVDRDMMNARQPGAVLKSTVGNVILQDLRLSPVFAGMDMRWGELN